MAQHSGKIARKPRSVPAPAIHHVTDEPATIVAAIVEPAGNPVMDSTTTMNVDADAMITDATERTKAGFAKGQAMFADMGEFSKGNVEALVESSRIAAKAFETLGRNAAAFMRASFDDAQAQARSLASVTSPTDMMKLQGDFARQSFDKMVAQTSTSTETMLKLAGEIAQPISNRMAIAADKMKVAA